MTVDPDATLLEVGGHAPEVASDAYIAAGARLLGRVHLAARTSVWFNAVLRADDEPIVIGEGSNVQDGTVMHVDRGFPIAIGRDCTIGHNAIIHGATVEDGALVGMGATVLNGARIGSGSIVGANALVPEGKIIPPNSLVLGVPGKVVRETTEADREGIARGVAGYQRRAWKYMDEGKRVG